MFFLRWDYRWGAGECLPLRKFDEGPRGLEQKVIGFEPNQRYVAN